MNPPSVDFDAALDRTARRFANGRHSTYHYVASKLRRDPSTRAIAELAPLGRVIDVGCGRGQLALFLHELGAATSVLGVDWDPQKVEAASLAASDLPSVSFTTADARAPNAGLTDIEEADTVLLIDVLHYMPLPDQDALLRAAAGLVAPGGRLILRDATSALGWRSAFTIGIENLSRLVRLNLGDATAIRDLEREIVPELEALELSCAITPCYRGTPFANLLIVATRAG